MATNPVKRYWTVEEYLAYEAETGMKHEYIDGEIYAFSASTEKHSLIATYASAELGYKLRGKSCRVYNSDMRVKITDIKYVYPDFSAVCGEAQFADDKRTMLINPTLVAEVISPSSANYDKGEKADFYRSLPSVQAYLLLDQERVHAQFYIRQESAWQLQEYSGLDAIIPLEALGISLPLSEAYRDIEFSDS